VPLIVPALPPHRQQSHRFQFLIRLHEEINALLALVLLHVVRKAVDVGVPELLTRHQIGRTFEGGNHFVRQFVVSFLAGH